MSDVLYHLRRAAVLLNDGGLTDGELLKRFVSQGEELSFEVLARRHASMVWGVCLRTLGNAHDAEDAFQATFLVLVRKAGSVKPREQVGNWLYGVASRTAQKARALLARRRAKEAQTPPAPSRAEDHWHDMRALLDRELNRLPDKYRVPIVLCDLEGKSRKEAARTLGWPEGTVSGRLARGRALLAQRLTVRGITLSAATLALALGELASAAEVPISLVQRTVRASLLVTAGKAVTSVVSSQAAALTKGVVKAMFWTKLKTVTAMFLGVGIVCGGMGFVTLQPQAAAISVPTKVAIAEAVNEELNADANSVSVQTMPPVVVKTVPQAGDTAVDAATVSEIQVSFSKKMMDQSWSWSQISDETFPKVTGKIRYDQERKTCVLPVKLEAGKTYVFWLNSERFQNFKDADGRPAIPYQLVFQTKK